MKLAEKVSGLKKLVSNRDEGHAWKVSQIDVLRSEWWGGTCMEDAKAMVLSEKQSIYPPWRELARSMKIMRGRRMRRRRRA